MNSAETNEKAESTTRCTRRGFREPYTSSERSTELVELVPCHVICHDVSAFINIQLSWLLYQYGYPSPPPPRPAPPPDFPLVAALGVPCCDALPALSRLAPVPSRHEAVHRVDDSPVPAPTAFSRPRPP